jgi:hypothetical protein
MGMSSFMKEPEKLYRLRRLLQLLAIAELALGAGLLLIQFLGLYLSRLYAFALTMQSLHGFTWAFIVALSMDHVTSIPLALLTTVVYIANFLLDFSSLIWRTSMLSRCYLHAGSCVDGLALVSSWLTWSFVVVIFFLDGAVMVMGFIAMREMKRQNDDIRLVMANVFNLVTDERILRMLNQHTILQKTKGE